jgi:hypothetical protein
MKTTKNTISERSIQYDVLDYFNKQKDTFAIQINNRPAYDPIRKSFVKLPKYSPKGTPDVLVHIKEKMFWCEIKRADGKQSIEQVGFQKKMFDMGIGYYLVRSVEDAIAALERERIK